MSKYYENNGWTCMGCGVFVLWTDTHVCPTPYIDDELKIQISTDRELLLDIVHRLKKIEEYINKLDK